MILVPIFQCGRFVFELKRPLVMGILNVTPDSFSDGGQYFLPDAAIARAERMIEEGADFLDIGGESSRPGATPVSEDQEIVRIIPVIEALRGRSVALSADTCKPAVMRAALGAGADMINDIRGFRDPEAVSIVQESACGLGVMHMQNMPQTMQLQPQYQDVVEEVEGFLCERTAALTRAGISPERMLIDPGFGFGKTAAHNLRLLQCLPAFTRLGFPLLVGLSRKSMLTTILGQASTQRQVASVTAAVMAVERGARVVRVHDVAETVAALRVWQAVHDGGTNPILK